MATTRPAPKPKPVFDIAALEAEMNDEERPPPCTTRLKSGKVITFIDPMELDWQVIAVLRKENPHSFFEAIIPDPKDLEAFYAETIKAPVIGKLINGYIEHYQLDNPGE